MGDGTGIEWTDATWNPIVGCSGVSPGCDGCYAIGVVHRAMSPQHVGLTVKPDGARVDWTGEVRLVPQVLDKPLRWRRPRRIFVNSLSDLFHADLPVEEIARVFAVMALAPQHTFQVLTKRPQRMADLLNDSAWPDAVLSAASKLAQPVELGGLGGPMQKAMVERDLHVLFREQLVLSNVWLGTSIESDRYAFRADHLRATPAAVRWISAEPLLGPLPSLDLTGIDWVVAGGESGPKAHPMHPAWVRDLRDRCQSNGWRLAERQATADEVDRIVASQPPGWAHERGPAFLFKQWGQWAPIEDDSVRYGEFHGGTDWVEACLCSEGDRGGELWRVGKKRAGREFDGRTWDEYPTAHQPMP